MTNNDDAYEAHMKKVDQVLRNHTGLGHEDGEDTDTRGRFDAGLTPYVHAKAIMEDWGFEDEEDTDEGDDGSWYADAYNRELEEDRLGRPLFPNEY